MPKLSAVPTHEGTNLLMPSIAPIDLDCCLYSTRALTRTTLLPLSNAGLRLHLAHSGRGIIFRLTTEMWPGSQPRYETGGQWYVAREEVTFRECPECSDRVPDAWVKSSEGRRRRPRQCEKCGTERAKIARRSPQTTRTGSSKVIDKQSRLRRSSRRDVNHIERGTSDEESMEESQQEVRERGLLLTVADPRYIGRGTEEAGSALNMDQVRQILQSEEDAEHCDGTVWMTTSQMSWTIGEEAGKSTGDRDGGRDGPTSRCIAPMISAFIRSRWGSDTVAEATARGRALARTWLMDQEWGDPDDEVGSERRDAKRIKQIASGPNWHEAVQETARGEKQWVSFQASGVNSGSALKLSISLASKSKIQLLFYCPVPKHDSHRWQCEKQIHRRTGSSGPADVVHPSEGSRRCMRLVSTSM